MTLVEAIKSLNKSISNLQRDIMITLLMMSFGAGLALGILIGIVLN